MIAKKRFTEARACFAKISYWNGKDPEQVKEWIFEREAMDLELPIGFNVQLEEENNKAPDVSWRDIWAIPVLRTNLWAAALLYAEGTFNFYLLSFYMKYFPGNIF